MYALYKQHAENYRRNVRYVFCCLKFISEDIINNKKRLLALTIHNVRKFARMSRRCESNGADKCCQFCCLLASQQNALCSYAVTADISTFKVRSFRLTQFLKKVKKKILTWHFLNRVPNFSLREWKHSKTRVTEEYCWAITQAVMLQLIRLQRIRVGISTGLPCIYIYRWLYVCWIPTCAETSTT